MVNKFFKEHKSVGTVVGKSIVLLLIPYAYLFLCGLVFDALLKMYSMTEFIFYSMIALFIAAIVGIVYMVVMFKKSGGVLSLNEVGDVEDIDEVVDKVVEEVVAKVEVVVEKAKEVEEVVVDKVKEVVEENTTDVKMNTKSETDTKSETVLESPVSALVNDPIKYSTEQSTEPTEPTEEPTEPTEEPTEQTELTEQTEQVN